MRLTLADGYVIDVDEEELKSKQAEIKAIADTYLVEIEEPDTDIDQYGVEWNIIKKVKIIPPEDALAFANAYRTLFGLETR